MVNQNSLRLCDSGYSFLFKSEHFQHYDAVEHANALNRPTIGCMVNNAYIYFSNWFYINTDMTVRYKGMQSICV